MSVGTSNPTEDQPYAAEGKDDIGRAPTPDAPGERGTSAFAGNSEFNADGTLKDTVVNPTQGSRRGVDYYQEQAPTPIHTGIQKNVMEPATAPAAPVAP